MQPFVTFFNTHCRAADLLFPDYLFDVWLPTKQVPHVVWHATDKISDILSNKICYLTLFGMLLIRYLLKSTLGNTRI